MVVRTNAIALLRDLAALAGGQGPEVTAAEVDRVIGRTTPSTAAGVIVTAHALGPQVFAGDGYQRIVEAAREKIGPAVDELAPGVTFAKDGRGEVVNFGAQQFQDLLGYQLPTYTTADFKKVTLVYAPDGDWSQTRSVDLGKIDDHGFRYFQAKLLTKNDQTRAEAKTIEYCLRLEDKTDRVHWINNGHKPDGTPLNYLHARNGGLAAQLLRFAATKASPEGAKVTLDEVSALVEQTTWRTRRGDQTLSDGELRGVRSAARAVRDRVGPDGLGPGAAEALDGFPSLPAGDLPQGFGLSLDRDGTTSLRYTQNSTSENDANALRVWYSTDGGNAWTEGDESQRIGGGRGGPVVVTTRLGALPPETPVILHVSVERDAGRWDFAATAPAPTP